jgi:hypothetical protein
MCAVRFGYRRSRVDRLDHTLRYGMKSLPVAVIADPISGHVFLAFRHAHTRDRDVLAAEPRRSTGTLLVAGLVLRVARTL